MGPYKVSTMLKGIHVKKNKKKQNKTLYVCCHYDTRFS